MSTNSAIRWHCSDAAPHSDARGQTGTTLLVCCSRWRPSRGGGGAQGPVTVPAPSPPCLSPGPQRKPVANGRWGDTSTDPPGSRVGGPRAIRPIVSGARLATTGASQVQDTSAALHLELGRSAQKSQQTPEIPHRVALGVLRGPWLPGIDSFRRGRARSPRSLQPGRGPWPSRDARRAVCGHPSCGIYVATAAAPGP